MSEPRTIVVATDGSAESSAAIETASEIAVAWKSPMTILTVVPPPTPMLGGPVPSDAGYAPLVEWYENALKSAAEAARGRGVPTVEPVLLHGPPVARVVEYLEDHPARMLVVGSRGLSGPARFILGSVSEGLVHHAPCSVLVIRPGSRSRSS